MAVLEVETFSLNPGVDHAGFRELDERMQEWCYVNRPGLARRTTAHTGDGSYIVITLFADASQAVPPGLPVRDASVTAWNDAVAQDSRAVTVYSLM